MKSIVRLPAYGRQAYLPTRQVRLFYCFLVFLPACRRGRFSCFLAKIIEKTCLPTVDLSAEGRQITNTF